MSEKRIKRKDSFFGLHFDFHAVHGDIIGKDTDRAAIAKALDLVRPDYVQCDTKGHSGLSSYPTKTGNRADEIKEDVLKIWRELTAERGIALYAHHSGLYDMACAADHPDWASVDEKGAVSNRFMSVFSPYADEFLIPQLLELALEYRLDGVWLDGECWATDVDYSVYARKAYRAKAGKEPPKKGEKGYEEYREFCRQGFRDYSAHVIRKVKERAPDFEMTSNWLYSAYMPERPEIPADFLSGDITPTQSVDCARSHSRYFMNQGMPWDLLSWGFNCANTWTAQNRTNKGLAQLCQEAAYIISTGGGWQLYNIQYGCGGMVQEWAIPLWAKAAEFCRERQQLCHKAKAVPQVGIVFSEAASVAGRSKLFTLGDEFTCANGWIYATQDAGYSCEILMTHHVLDRDIQKFGLLILPEVNAMEKELAQKLKDYVANGGRLIIGGPDAASHFSDILTCSLDKFDTVKVFHVEGGGALSAVESKFAIIDKGNGEIAGNIYEQNYITDSAQAAAVYESYKNGRMCVLAFDYGSIYAKNRTSALRDFCADKLLNLFPTPIVKAKGGANLHTAIMEKDGSLMINLLNYAGPHNDSFIRSFDEIPSIGPVEVSVLCKSKPASVTLEPGHKKCDFIYNGERATFIVDKIDIHVIAVIDNIID